MVAAVPGEVGGSLRGQEHDTKVQVLHPAHSKRVREEMWHRRASDGPHPLLRGSFCCSTEQAGSSAELRLCDSASCVSLRKRG